jgi:hypothetical protein
LALTSRGRRSRLRAQPNRRAEDWDFCSHSQLLWSLPTTVWIRAEADTTKGLAPSHSLLRDLLVPVSDCCINCHVPPNYTSGRLTLAQGFTPASGHPNEGDILSVSEAPLALRTRKGTGFYKIPSLRGLWNRPALLHDGSVATLDDMFDPERLTKARPRAGWVAGTGSNKTIDSRSPIRARSEFRRQESATRVLRTL